jgi:hypothetical protein
VPLADPATGQLKVVRLSHREARRRKAQNEDRLEQLLQEMRSFGLEPLLVATTDATEVNSSFLAWADLRAHAVWGPS